MLELRDAVLEDANTLEHAHARLLAFAARDFDSTLLVVLP